MKYINHYLARSIATMALSPSYSLEELFSITAFKQSKRVFDAVLTLSFCRVLWLQSSEPVKELYTQLTEKLEAQKKSPPPLEETPSLDLGLHPVTVPSTASTPTTPL